MTIARLRGAAAALLFLWPGSPLAQETATPEKALQSLYASYLGDEEPDERKYFSAPLRKLYDADQAKAENGEDGNLDFDPVIGGQDYEIKELKVGEPALNGDIAVVDVEFRNFDTPAHLKYTMRREGETWKVDDIESVDPDNPWTLSRILAGASN
jgi:hypothetical protein